MPARCIAGALAPLPTTMASLAPLLPTLCAAAPRARRSTTTRRAHPSAAAAHAHVALSARFATAATALRSRPMRVRPTRAVVRVVKAEEGEEEMMIEEMAMEKFEKSLDALETNLQSVRDAVPPRLSSGATQESIGAQLDRASSDMHVTRPQCAQAGHPTILKPQPLPHSTVPHAIPQLGNGAAAFGVDAHLLGAWIHGPGTCAGESMSALQPLAGPTPSWCTR